MANMHQNVQILVQMYCRFATRDVGVEPGEKSRGKNPQLRILLWNLNVYAENPATIYFIADLLQILTSPLKGKPAIKSATYPLQKLTCCGFKSICLT